jgi:hypothetical protein
MVQFEIENERMKEWFPITYQTFIEELRNSNSTSADKAEDKIEWMVSWGVFRTKAKTEQEQIQKDIEFENKLKLPYKERCKTDLPKLRITVTMKAGYRVVSDRSLDEGIPQYIQEMFYEIMKITMLQEQMVVNDPVVLESLDEFKHLLEDFLDEFNMDIEMEGMEDIKKAYKKEENPLSMDEILDKISATGMQSLTAKELKFLEKMSRG